jgi:hypothetical protein
LPELPNAAFSNLAITLAAKHLIRHSQWQQNTLHENIKNDLALPNASNYTGGKMWQFQILPITLVAKHHVEIIKNMAFTNPEFMGASHFAGIPKSGNAKFWQLHWQQNNLVKISKIRCSQGQVTLPELLNPALPNCRTYTGSKTTW